MSTDFALMGIKILLREGYEQALKTGRLDHQPDGSAVFTFLVPAPVNQPCRGIRLPKGEFYLHMKDLHQLMGGESLVPFEHFEHTAQEFAAGRPPAQGFGQGMK
jgi:hypothetical protein